MCEVRSKFTDPDSHTIPETKRTKLSLNPDEFDVYGFDMDLTLVEYHTLYLTEWVYTGLQNYLIEECGYSRDVFQPISQIKHMFFRGVTIDVDKGLVLQVDKDGVVVQAFYGLKPLTREEIVKIYGEGTWSEWENIFQDHLIGSYPDSKKQIDETSRTTYIFDSEFDISASGVFSCVVESIKNSETKPEDLKVKFNNVWKNIAAAFSNLYKIDQGIARKHSFYAQCKQRPEDFIKKLGQKTIDCLKALKAKGKCIFLLTTSNYDYTDDILKTAYGDAWRDLFSVVLTHAKKPGYFSSKGQTLYKVSLSEGKLEACDSIENGCLYTEGNVDYLNTFLAQYTNKERPRVLYVGDNLRADIFGACRVPNWKCGCIIDNLSEVLEMRTKKGSEMVELADTFMPNSHISTRNGSSTFWYEKMLSLCYLLAPNVGSMCEVLSGDVTVDETCQVIMGYSI